MGQTMVKLCQKNNTLVGITAAMPSGTGMKHLEKAMPDRYYDVGIAEEHAVIFAAGMATMGFHPVVAIYSTFLQRAYDCIHHDVCLQDLPVIFCMDRAGLSANDGPTHHGLFDIAYLRCLPNVIAMAPKDEDELVDMMFTATHQRHPTFIRYPARRGGRRADQGPAQAARNRQGGGHPELFQQWQTQGRAVRPRPDERHRPQGGGATWRRKGFDVAVINPRFTKPLDAGTTNFSAGGGRGRDAGRPRADGRLRLGGAGTVQRESHHDARRAHRLAGPIHRARHDARKNELRKRNTA
jgi:1-deoxy-D-xylulose-5-phosphate synthase